MRSCRTTSLLGVAKMAAVTATLSGEALAGPWAQDKGSWIDITDASLERSGDNFEHASLRPGYYGELGLAPKWTAMVKWQALLRENQSPQSVDIGLRRELWRGQRAALGVEIEGLLGQSLLGPGCGQGVGIRASLGSGLNLANMHGFAVVDATLHYRGNACLRRKASAIVGLDPTPRWQAVAKVYYENGNDVISIKLEGSLARRIGERFTIGLGYRSEVGGRFQEQAILIFIQRRSSG